MKCNLPSIGNCDVVIRYGRDENNRPVFTDITVFQIQDNSEIVIGYGESACHVNDECRKDMGRAYAIKNMLKTFGGNFSKEDRTVLFAKVCPKFFPEKKILTLFKNGHPGYDWLVERD